MHFQYHSKSRVQNPDHNYDDDEFNEFNFSKLDTDFDTDGVRSWKTVCPQCRAIGRPFRC